MNRNRKVKKQNGESLTAKLLLATAIIQLSAAIIDLIRALTG